MVGLRIYSQQTGALNQSLHRLATGKRINRGADDPAGLIAAENLAARSASIRAEVWSLERNSSRLSVREAAYSTISDMLEQLETLIVAAANRGGVSREELEARQVEADGIVQGIDFVLRTTSFNGQRLFAGQSAANMGAAFVPDDYEVPAQTVNLTMIASGGTLNLITGDAEGAQELVREAARNIAKIRAGIGALQRNYYDRYANSLRLELEAVSHSESIIRDADYAREVSELTRARVLQQAALGSLLAARQSAAAATLSLI